jgi:ribosomal protein S18 acetylase RimI-like enzyme
MKVTISPFTLEHYDQVFDLWKSCKGIGLSEADSKGNIEKFLRHNNGLSLIAEQEKKIIGVLLIGHDGRRGYIHHLAVSPCSRRKGIGKELVESGVERLKAIGITKCHIFVFNNNESGKHFWEKCGWKYREELGIISKIIQ